MEKSEQNKVLSHQTKCVGVHLNSNIRFTKPSSDKKERCNSMQLCESMGTFYLNSYGNLNKLFASFFCSFRFLYAISGFYLCIEQKIATILSIEVQSKSMAIIFYIESNQELKVHYHRVDFPSNLDVMLQRVESHENRQILCTISTSSKGSEEKNNGTQIEGNKLIKHNVKRI